MLTWAVAFLTTGAIAGFYSLGEARSFPTKMARVFFCFFITLFILTIIYSFLPAPYIAS